MNKAQAQSYAFEKINELLPSDWTFVWSNGKKILGYCCYRNKHISLSLYTIGRVSDEEQKDTILHEIAHALNWIENNQRGHGKSWKTICKRIGAIPQRCFKGKISNTEYKYELKCPKCNHTAGLHRMSKKIKMGLKTGQCHYPCRKCNTKREVYEDKKLLVSYEACTV